MQTTIQPPPASAQELAARYLRTVQALEAAALAAQKTIAIHIAPGDLAALHRGGYRLCVAKKVAGYEYNVAWHTWGDYFSSNMFSWTPQYQLFASRQFHEGTFVDVVSNLVSVGLGDTCLLNRDCRVSEPSARGRETAITLSNDYGPVHAGLMQLARGLDGRVSSAPIHVSPKPVLGGDLELTPLERVLVWFERHLDAGTQFSKPRANSVEIDLTWSNAQARRFEDGKWREV